MVGLWPGFFYNVESTTPLIFYFESLVDLSLCIAWSSEITFLRECYLSYPIYLYLSLIFLLTGVVWIARLFSCQKIFLPTLFVILAYLYITPLVIIGALTFVARIIAILVGYKNSSWYIHQNFPLQDFFLGINNPTSFLLTLKFSHMLDSHNRQGENIFVSVLLFSIADPEISYCHSYDSA